MSGGSWDYVSNKFEDVADRLEGERCPLRKALAAKIRPIARAMHAIEWNDSGDGHDGEQELIEAVLGLSAEKIILTSLIEDARKVRDELTVLLEKVTP